MLTMNGFSSTVNV